jgi:hypothetical protein
MLFSLGRESESAAAAALTVTESALIALHCTRMLPVGRSHDPHSARRSSGSSRWPRRASEPGAEALADCAHGLRGRASERLGDVRADLQEPDRAGPDAVRHDRPRADGLIDPAPTGRLGSLHPMRLGPLVRTAVDAAITTAVTRCRTVDP